MRAWLRVQTDANAPDGAGPCQRSLHVAAVWRDRMLCFGGYDGSHRVDLGVPRCCGAFTPSTRLVAIREGDVWSLVQI